MDLIVYLATFVLLLNLLLPLCKCQHDTEHKDMKRKGLPSLIQPRDCSFTKNYAVFDLKGIYTLCFAK